MTRYSGFYDLPTAWSNVFWGILIGGLYGSSIYSYTIIPTIEFEASGEGQIANPVNLVLLCLIASIASHFILRRKRVRSGSSTNNQRMGTWPSNWRYVWDGSDICRLKDI